MTEQIIEISDRGQITIPKKVRDMFKGQILTLTVEENHIILTPVQTVNQFFEELDKREKDWEKNGGISFEEIIERHDL